ncbi:MAG: hypothetical protein HN849_09515, partial [Victivallales bacterium]|nr:hypothetical protein [Victivallales bacterium]
MQLTPANVIRVHRQEITPGEAFAEQAVEEARTAAHWPPVLLARLAEAGLRIHRPDLAAYRARLAAQDLPPRPIGLPPPGPIVLVPYSSTHLGDTLALSHLPRLLAAQGYAVHVKDTPSTRAVFANNPHVLGFGGDYPTIRQRFARNARGHIMQLVARAAGCQADPFPRPEIHLTRAERGWAEAERDAWPTDRPAILVSTGAVTSREGYHGVDWQAYVDALAQTCHVVCPIVSSPATLVGRHGRGKAVADLVPDRCTVYADLPTRRFMALVAVCDAAIGTMAGTSHVAAALGVPYLCILPAVRPEGWELQFPVRGVSGNCDSRWLYPQHIFAYPEERPAAFPFTRAQVREQIIHPSEREHTTPGQISHVLTKYLLARQYQPSRIVEVGVRYGYAAAAFLLACPSAEYTGHDIICLGKGSNGGLGDGVNTFPAVRDLLARLAPEASVTLHHLNTQAMPTFPPADFYHIDGDHSIQGALSDICKAFAAADPGGVIVVDDYDHLRPVRQACDLFARQNRDQLAAAYYVPSWRGEFVLEKAGPGTDPDAPGRWSPGGELSTLQTQWAPPVQNVALVSSGMLASQMVRSLQSVTSRHGLDLPAHRSTDDYSQRFAAARNLVTWGVKWPSSRYQRDGRNVLFTENALLSQRSGIYIDHAGYFCDSSIAT